MTQRIGVIGLGNVAQLHVTALNEISPGVFAGGWARCVDKAIAFCEVNGGRAYEDLSSLLAEPEIGAILVATNTANHFDHARSALEAGKHVLLEKPLCQTSQQVQQLDEIARACSRICMPSHNYIYSENMRRLKHHCATGRLGDLLSFWMIYNKRHDASIGAPGLTLRELMIHHFYSLLHYMGRPDYVSATASNVHFEDTAAHDQIMVTASYNDGRIGNLWGSFSADDQSREPWSVYYKIIGREGSAVVPWDITKFGEAQLPFWDDATYWDSFVQVERYFLEEVLGKGGEPLSTMQDAYESLCLLEAVQDAIETGQRVKVHYG